MNCIFLCVFYDINYIKFLFMLLESIYIYGNIKETETEVLIYTSSQFMNAIKKSHMFSQKIQFETNDEYDTVDKACKARLNIFSLPSIAKYNKILYLDLDIIIKSDMNVIFDVIEEDILYVLEEGSIGSHEYKDDYWGNSLFGEEIEKYEGKSAFTSGILLFHNCEKIKQLFETIKLHISINPHNFNDQPHIVYNAMKYNLYDNQKLKLFAVNRDQNIDSDKIIHHFPGGPGIYENRITRVSNFLRNIKEETILDCTNKAKEYLQTYLMRIIHNCETKLEGNHMLYYYTKLYRSICSNPNNISNLLLNKNINNILVIGFNSGFSILVMLLSNPYIQITCFDIGKNPYTLICYEKLKETFGNRINLIISEDVNKLASINEVFDLIHIDQDMFDIEDSSKILDFFIVYAYRLSKHRTIFIMDNYDLQGIKEIWNYYVTMYGLISLDIKMAETNYQDIKYVNAL